MTRSFLMTSIRLAALAAATLLPGMACTYSATSAVAGANGGNIAVRISTQPGCKWEVSAPAAWTQIFSAHSGSGNGTVYVYVTPDRGGARVADINGFAVVTGCTGIPGRSGCVPGGETLVFRSTVTQY